MHQSTFERMKWFRDTFNPKGSVLDVGSYDVNGTYRELFKDYTGLDMTEGPNVDIVVNPYKWDIEIESYDNVISGSTFEHSEFFWITMQECVRVCKYNGLICIIAPAIWEEHRFPVDCYRFLTDGMVALARYYKLEILHADHTKDCMLVARKPYYGLKIVELEKYKCEPADYEVIQKKNFSTKKSDGFIFIE